MTDNELGTLFNAYTNYYWSLPVKYVADKISERHPDVTAEQFERVLNQCNDDVFLYHCSVEDEGLEEPELTAEHLTAVDYDDFKRFIAIRMDLPFCDCDEDTLLKLIYGQPDLPEVDAIREFGAKHLGLDDEWCTQLVDDCLLSQPNALCDGESWVMSVLNSEQFGKIQFRTLGQVKRFRTLGNSLYQVVPNPILRGWKPSEIDNPPVLLDDIPNSSEDIPDMHEETEEVISRLRKYANSNWSIAKKRGKAGKKSKRRR